MEVWWVIQLFWNSVVDVFMFLVTTLLLKDTETPVKGPPGVEFTPRRFVWRTTVNNVALGVTQAGLSRWAILQALADMMEKDGEAKWGNWIGYVILPFTIAIRDDPLDYVRKVKATVDRKKHSYEALYTFSIAEIIFKLFGIKTASALSHRTIYHTTMCFSNLVGPQEEIGFYGHPIAYIAPSSFDQPHCGDHKRRCGLWMTRETGSNEFISALAAGMKAKLIVEITSDVSPSTVALATAARHTGGRLVCILPEPVLAESKKVIRDSGPHDEDADVSVEDHQSGENNGGGATTLAAPEVDRSELCNIDTSSFLPPPYSNISGMRYVGWFNKEGHARIKQFYLQGARPSQVIADAGELDLTKVPPAVVLHGPMIYLAFQAKFEKTLTRQPIILAFGTKYPKHHRLSIHDDKTTILFDFSAGSASSGYANPGQMKKNHGILGIFAWGLLLPVGAIVARYMKHKDPLWYYLHAGIQFVGFLFALATVVLGQQLYSKINARIPAHRSIGIFVLTLSILQILAFFLRPKKDVKIRKYWNWYHGWFGRIALFFGALNVVLGIHAGSAGIGWKICYGFLISTILVTVIILEILSWMWRSETTPPPSFQMNPIS
ncbi:hypothetical protein GH714_021022 [Hevea brasiliensis]|uniref:Cytochrome b561 domain-containing protein n=1 Tax=Hevea brasiliensis TaxID=3981 RepID=A0A6A6NI87_HEVBR|nr:hypothetical protein GH714_021022 [Hevea brasiliensis]